MGKNSNDYPPPYDKEKEETALFMAALTLILIMIIMFALGAVLQQLGISLIKLVKMKS
ncbi:MAG: hypothetical protein NT136_03175 [Candidatus Moranbacteria bacterium]|nr:hypothetical protein [Candidatus Moranbacteria bacterium]